MSHLSPRTDGPELLHPEQLRRWLAERRRGLWDAVHELRQAARNLDPSADAPAGDRSQRARGAAVGLALGRAHAAILDEMLRELFAAVTTAEQASTVALAGVGGHGRETVALGADLDVRLLAPAIEQAEPVAEALLYPLWDSGLPVGHQVQTVQSLVETARADLATATSLLDWRHVAGDPDLTAELQARARAGPFSPSALPQFLERLDREGSGRQQRFGRSVYLLEPDVKNGPGGLRDVDVARWAAQARWGVRRLDGLLRLGVLVPRELSAVEQARELLWRIRNVLHGRAGRRSDRLGFDAQEEVARTLGYAGPLRDAVGRFMSDYYRAARVLSRFRESMLVRATPNLARRRPRLRRIGDSLQLFGGVVTTDPERLREQPEHALRLLAAAVEHDVPLSPHARDVINRLADDAGWCAQLRASEAASRLFVELVSCRSRTALHAGSAVRELHELGLLLAMIPEFSPVVGRVHHDTYHVFTVDVHSVAAVDRLGEILRGDVMVDEEQLPRWEGSLVLRLAAEVTRSEVLFFATLLHDVGKAIGRADHSERGAEMARGVLERLGFAPPDVEDACRLIANHLVMYRVATRRDLDDPAAITELVRQVGGREALRHLYLLTVADISTTSPTSMTAWKARMLDELYLAAEQRLRG
ncbi:MAG: HD domain-containing protein, partial [Deltaproteobacteria bacterium]|nr:HD domain-containing protein [Deltaproteobacteria bacterium]MBW2537857.1 HD domain-containing protein [Deltaproteobacteria bacterium]